MHEILHFVQNDKHGIFMIPTQSLEGEKRYFEQPAIEVKTTPLLILFILGLQASVWLTAEALDVRKHSKTITYANSASAKSNSCDCSFLEKSIFSHDR